MGSPEPGSCLILGFRPEDMVITTRAIYVSGEAEYIEQPMTITARLPLANYVNDVCSGLRVEKVGTLEIVKTCFLCAN